ncbi:hypothetical protein DRQ16_03670 [bacterium]|nr:MAG: hypothetical protein DRQ16_03670 [bacterium]RKZ22492.1 MAG: hypothetical protein DRQ18_02490 [bacterium]RKZ27582.1 MAG: hypothetical protein DRQ20_00065 [bacterium]
MGLQGNLRDFEITDVLQLIHMGQKDGVLKIKTEDDEGAVYFEGGLVTHAETRETEGEKAIQVILTWTEGEFIFETNVKSEKRTIELPIQNVILEAARQIDEWKRMEKVIPSVDVVVDFVEDPDVGNIELLPEEWRVLTSVDGNKSISEIADSLKMKEFDVARILYGLVSSGLIKVCGEKKKKKEKEEKKEEKEPPRKGGFFRRR